MKLRVSLSLLALCLAIPAMAQTVYSNGPINGTTDAWTINFGFVVSDTFTVPTGGASIDGLVFGAWLFPGDTLENAGVQITSSEFGGTTFFSGTVDFVQTACHGNQYGHNVCDETGSFSPVNLAAGTYWLNLDNAVVNNGDPLYWDENSGPSSASENSIGTIPSESFTILGGTTSTTGGTTPEPSSIMLFGSAILGLAGVLRRKLF
jgi:PEP-CTERM motif